MDFLERKVRCKHIYAVFYYLMLREVTIGVKKAEPEPVCKTCGSSKFLVKAGFRYNRSGPLQRFYCKRCNTYSADRYGFEKMKTQAFAIVSALDLYFRGISLRQISEHLLSLFGIDVSYGTIYNWIRKYVELVHEFTKDLKLPTSERWHADETSTRVRGRQTIIWSLLDSETRILVAFHISRRKNVEEASVLLRKGLAASENYPSEIVTDGLPSYAKAIEMEFNKTCTNAGSKVMHILGPLVGKINNNKIERFNGLVKARIRAMSHFNNETGTETFEKGFPIYYNWIRGHKALRGQAPAIASGNVGLPCTWLDLILASKVASRTDKPSLSLEGSHKIKELSGGCK
jgi:transposase-like protein